MKILLTGIAGFIGMHTALRLLKEGHQVIGVDNLNDYYPVSLKIARLKELGIETTKEHFSEGSVYRSTIYYNNCLFMKCGLESKATILKIFEDHQFDVVCNLAAQAGVRYSLENPSTYVESNVVGFLNILEGCRHHNVKKLVYASSSSVYGLNSKIPFSTDDRTDQPISLYAATKKSNELMAFTYNHLYGIQTTGLRFFTVYGPWGRPDMAPYLFTDAIANDRPIQVFNHGKMERDFTYVDDIVEGVVRITTDTKENETAEVYNIGNNKSEKLMDFISEIETNLGKTAEKNMMPIQPGDVERTWADVTNLENTYGYKPKITIQQGVKEFVEWYKRYYGQ